MDLKSWAHQWGLKTGGGDYSILAMVVGRKHIRQSTYQEGGKSNEKLNSCVFVLLYLLTLTKYVNIWSFKKIDINYIM